MQGTTRRWVYQPGWRCRLSRGEPAWAGAIGASTGEGRGLAAAARAGEGVAGCVRPEPVGGTGGARLAGWAGIWPRVGRRCCCAAWCCGGCGPGAGAGAGLAAAGAVGLWLWRGLGVGWPGLSERALWYWVERGLWHGQRLFVVGYLGLALSQPRWRLGLSCLGLAVWMSSQRCGGRGGGGPVGEGGTAGRRELPGTRVGTSRSGWPGTTLSACACWCCF